MIPNLPRPEAAIPEQLSCSWCARYFEPRRTGGRDQHFCRPACRRALHAEARSWVLTELAAGRLPLNVIKSGTPATCALEAAPGKVASVPDIADGGLLSGSRPPEPVAQFYITIPTTLIDKLVLVHFEIGNHERGDIRALLSGLARAGREPTIAKTSECRTILSY